MRGLDYFGSPINISFFIVWFFKGTNKFGSVNDGASSIIHILMFKSFKIELLVLPIVLNIISAYLKHIYIKKYQYILYKLLF